MGMAKTKNLCGMSHLLNAGERVRRYMKQSKQIGLVFYEQVLAMHRSLLTKQSTTGCLNF